MNAEDALRRSLAEFERRLDRVGDAQWQARTPCTEWDVRALVNHVVSELRWVPPLVEGKTIAEVGDALTGDLLGDDPTTAFSSAGQEALAAAAQPGTSQRMVHLSYGDRDAGDYLREVSSDLVIHSWDLARAAGADERLDPELVALAEASLSGGIEGARAAGYFGPAVQVAPGTDAQTRLLALTGRRAEG